MYPQQECIPVGCVPPAHWPYFVVSATHVPHPLPHPPTMHTCPPAMHTPCHTRPLPPPHHARPNPFGQNSWHTLLKILPCPKLRLRAVKMVAVNLCEIILDSDVGMKSCSKAKLGDVTLTPRSLNVHETPKVSAECHGRPLRARSRWRPYCQGHRLLYNLAGPQELAVW